jgi:hypothetical protein
MSQRIASCVATLLALTVLSIPAGASAEEEAHDGAAHGATHAYHEHIFGLFVGGAEEDSGRRENGFVLGLEYEYRFNQSFGIGAVVEHTYGDLDIWVYAVPFAYHNGPWKMYVAPGVEEGEGGSENMLRFGVEYGFHAGKWEISPQIDIDFVERESDVFVIGVVFARGFDF